MKFIKIITALPIAIALICASIATSHAEMLVSDNNTKIIFVSVNGGTDSPNPGTTCIKVSDTVSENCTAGFIAIPRNNKELLSAAFQAKATSSSIWLNYSDSADQQHCPGQSFTNCTVSGIGLK